jgi:hypothetical protein
MWIPLECREHTASRKDVGAKKFAVGVEMGARRVIRW